MLKKKQRLTSKEFDKIFANNRSSKTASLLLLEPRQDELRSKYAVVVSKKTYRRRVDRNRLRRLIYGLINEFITNNTEKVKSGIVIVGKKTDLLATEPQQLRAELEVLLLG